MVCGEVVGGVVVGLDEPALGAAARVVVACWRVEEGGVCDGDVACRGRDEGGKLVLCWITGGF